MVFNLLVYSEDSYIASMLEHTFSANTYKIQTVYEKRQLSDHLEHQPVTLVVMHLHHLSAEEFECCRLIGEIYGVPFIVVIGDLSQPIRLQILRLGAFDCLTEDCKMEELTVRIQNVLRFLEIIFKRSTGLEQPQHMIRLSNSLHVNKRCQYVMRGNEQIYLSPIESRLLKYLLEHSNEIVDAQQLLEVGWGDIYPAGRDELRDELYVYIRSLRKKLDSKGQPSFIKSFYGKGYLLQKVTPLLANPQSIVLSYN